MEMNDEKRLGLLVETVKYCKRVQAKGMPPSCFTKALREPVHYLWERRVGTKIQSAQYRSKAAVGLKFGKRQLVYDHAVPFSLLQEQLLKLSPVTKESVRELLDTFGTICLITKDEDTALNSAGLIRSMPPKWDRKNVFARYEAVGIELVENEDYSLAVGRSCRG